MCSMHIKIFNNWCDGLTKKKNQLIVRFNGGWSRLNNNFLLKLEEQSLYPYNVNWVG